MDRKTLLFVFWKYFSDKSNDSSFSQIAHGVKSYNYGREPVSKQLGHRDLFLCFVLGEKAV